ncbi:hypothetical protein [Paenibacillus ginsengarvi]|uniref:Uncharacterized protein n=1 Tax=Paenibacillus ginsengarvi TaxID=400777 RepID=A0A3B0B232_9BACL|nr:hypothetical protein [Paenibacillus ginsengarvi]RKN66058.1 hypothetical protein D7M11_31785 [Paenibacillus ginsengarvi]
MKNRIYSGEKANINQREELERSGQIPAEPKTLSRRKLLASMGMAGVAMAVTGSLGAASERDLPGKAIGSVPPFLDELNETVIRSVNSISALIQQSDRFDGQIFEVVSFHADQKIGGDLFMWSATIDKSLHDGGYIIDPNIPFPGITVFNTYYTALNTGGGVFVRLNNESHVDAENYGAIPLTSMVWNCAAIQQALHKAAAFTTPKQVHVGVGVYQTTNPIIISTYPNYGNTIRVPQLIGAGRLNTEIWKVANSTIPSGIYRAGDNIDAVIFASGRLDNASENLMGEVVKGFQLMRISVAKWQGYGYFSYKSIYGERTDLNCIQCNIGYWQDDCWMSQVNNIKATNSITTAIAIRGGTSVTGRNLYADTCQGVGFDLTNLTYSDLGIHADLCGGGSVNGTYAIKCDRTIGTRLLASTEFHKGTEFYFKSCEGLIITGRSYGTAAIATGVIPKIEASASSVLFEGYSWRNSLNQLSQAEADKYKLLTKDAVGTNIAFRACMMSPAYKDFPVYVADFRFMGDLQYSTYSEINRVISSQVKLQNGSFKKLAYVGDTARIKIVSAICTDTAHDRMYIFPDIGIAKASISANSASPTKLSTSLYINGVVDSADGGVTESQRYALYGYVDANGWLLVTVQTAGNNLEFGFVVNK